MKKMIILIFFWPKTLFFHMVSGPGIQFSHENIVLKLLFFYREKLPVKSHGSKTRVFILIFEEALKGLIRTLRAL